MLTTIGSLLMTAQWAAIGTGIVTFAGGVASFSTSATTFWQHLQKLKSKPLQSRITRLLKESRVPKDLEVFGKEFDDEIRPLVIAILKRQMVFYTAVGLLMTTAVSIAFVFIYFLVKWLLLNVVFISDPLEQALTYAVPILGTAIGLAARTFTSNPNQVFEEATKKVGNWLNGREVWLWRVEDLQSLAAKALSTTQSAWQVATSRVATEEEIRLVEEFVAADTLIRNLVARDLARDIVRLKLKLAVPMRDEIIRTLAQTIHSRRDDFKQLEGAQPQTDGWRRRTRDVLIEVFERQGLRSEFTQWLDGGFLDNDFYTAAEKTEQLEKLFSSHLTMFREQNANR